MAQPRIHLLATLNLPHLLKLTNDLVCHDLMWPAVPAKLPSYILKFEGKNGEDPRDHVTNFHLWFSSNSLNHDYVHLQQFQYTLTDLVAKWYIDLPGPHILLLTIYP